MKESLSKTTGIETNPLEKGRKVRTLRNFDASTW